MAQQGTRHHSIAFGDYEITVSKKKARFSRDLKTELVRADGTKKGAGGSSSGYGGGSRTPDSDAGESRAVRLPGDRIVRLPQDRLDAIVETSKEKYDTMRVLETIDYRQVPTERIGEAYWLQPQAGTARGLRLLAEGLKDSGRVAVVKWTEKGASPREKLGVIRVRHYRVAGVEKLALLLSEIAFANDFLPPDEDALSINDVELENPERSIGAARALVTSLKRRSDSPYPTIDTASDEAVDARLALLDELTNAELDEALEAYAEPAPADPAPVLVDDVAAGDPVQTEESVGTFTK